MAGKILLSSIRDGWLMRTPDEEPMRSQLPHLQMGKLKAREGKSYSWDETLDTESSGLFTIPGSAQLRGKLVWAHSYVCWGAGMVRGI